jgi:4-amino-4-deoxy-L-arabinose transferase-like glycosyltransferase
MTVATEKKKARKTTSTSDIGSRLRGVHWSTWALLIVILFFAGIRYRLSDVPLERDEGEYAYSGQLMLDGTPPYQSSYNMKLPGTYAAYAAIMAVFGQTATGIHIGLLLVNAGTTLLLVWIGRNLFGSIAGAFSGMAYAALSASPAVFGLAGHATHFVVTAALSGLLLLLYALETDRVALYFCSGTCLGLAFLMKQPGIVFAVFALLYFFYRKWHRLRDWRYIGTSASAMMAGVAWPFGLTCLVLYRAGVFSKFWFWTVSYARAYGTTLPFTLAVQVFRHTALDILRLNGAIWIIVVLGFVVLFLRPQYRVHSLFVAGLTVLSFLGVSAGLYFRNHYFILLLPALALVAGIGVDWGIELLKERNSSPAVAVIPAMVFGVAIIVTIAAQSRFFFAITPVVASQRMYRANPFVEAKDISEYLKQTAPHGAKLAIFGSEPEIYFYSHLHSATGYIYTYSLMEDQPYATQMQQEMIREVSDAKPDYVIFVDDELSWLWQPGGSRELFFKWMQLYINPQYVKAAQVDIAGSPGHLLGDTARIYLFQRKSQ